MSVEHNVWDYKLLIEPSEILIDFKESVKEKAMKRDCEWFIWLRFAYRAAAKQTGEKKPTKKDNKTCSALVLLRSPVFRAKNGVSRSKRETLIDGERDIARKYRERRERE